MAHDTVPPASTERRLLVEAVRRIEQLTAAGAGSRTAEPVAVIGLGCRMPGGVSDPEGFWRLLRDGVDATGEFPAARADASRLFDPDPEAPGKAYVTRGGFLDEVDRFEPGVFGISPREAVGMDPQQRLVLQVVWEALERAGYAPDGLEGSQTGVFLGVSTTDYVRARQEVGDIRDVDGYQLIGEPSFVAGRVSYTFGLMGPSKVVDTTCSSSLVALHDACQALRLGECDLALAGGVNLMLTPYSFVLLSKFRALSPDGRCKTFDAAADGYARGEGVGVVVLKRLSDALAARDNILAVVRGTAVNHDGRSSGISVPNPAAQQAVIRSALAQARMEPAEIGYVEAHGTGTSLGDPIELRALQQVIGRHHAGGTPLLVGSVKTNIGHLESAAGAAGLLKLVLSLQHQEIPPHLHLREPNPNVDWNALDIEVVTARRPWPADLPVKAGAISSFGASGTNAHAIVTEPPAPVPGTAVGPARTTNVVTLSARSETALRALARDYAAALRAEPGLSPADIALTTHVGRSRLPLGVATAGTGTLELADGLEAFAAGRREDRTITGSLALPRQRKVAWLFTGQGSQYPRMGELLRTEPAYAAAIEEVAAHLDPLLDRPLADLLAEAATDPADPADPASPLHRTGFAQPALFAVEYAMARLWQSWGVQPAALTGHSVGEIVAATVADVMDLADACRLVAARGRLMQALPSGGVMATVVCDEARALAAIAGHRDTVAVAAVNSPADTVLSGPAADIAAITAELAKEGIKSRLLTVSHAFHSPLMNPALDELREVARTIGYRAPRIPLVSNVTGALVRPGEIDADYWVRHAAGTVRFADGLRTLYDDSFRTFLEIGPQPVLSGLGARGLDDAGCLFIPTLRRGVDDRQSVMTGLGALHLRGVAVDWAAYHEGDGARRVPLPTYAWEGDSYWFPEAGTEAAATAGVPAPGIGQRLRSARPAYQLDLTDSHWPRQAWDQGEGLPRISDGSLLTAALAAAADGLGGAWAGSGELVAAEPLALDDTRTVHLTLEDAGTTATFEVRSTSAAEEASAAPWRLHLSGVLRRRPGPAGPPFAGGGRSGTELDWKRAGLPAAAAEVLLRAERGDDGVQLQLAGGAAQGRAAVLDAAVTAVAWAADRTAGRPAAIGFAAAVDPAAVRWVQAVAEAAADGSVRGRADLYGAGQEWLGAVDGVEIPAADTRPAPEPWRDPDELLYRLEWQPAEEGAAGPQQPREGDVLLIADAGGLADRFAAALTGAGAVCTVTRPPAGEPGDEPGGTLHADWLAETLGAWRTRRAGRAGRVIVLTGLDAPEPDATDAAALVDHRDRAELLAVGVVQALQAEPGDQEVRLTLVTRGGVAAGDDQRTHAPAATTLWGLGRVIALEHPRHWGGAIDLDPDAADVDPAALVDALARSADEDQQALRGGARLVARIVADRPARAELRREVAVRPDGGYLITGAFGGIGQEVARWLALRGAGRLVLLGRTELPDRGRWDDPALGEGVAQRIRLVRELEGIGADVRVVAADVADQAAISALVAELAADPGTPLAGVVHAAGVSGPQFVREVSRPEYDRVWRPKVLGGWALHRATERVPLDFFLGLSSIAATWGSQHLTSYAAANAFLDGLAYHRRSRGLAALTIAWSSWELESALFDGEIAAFLAATGLRPLSAPQSLRLLGALLDGGEPYRIVCSAHWPTYKSILEARAERPVLRRIETGEPEQGGGTAAIRADLLAAAPEQRPGLLDTYVREQLAQLLRLPVADLAGEFHLLDMGLDSLMVMELITRCRKDLGVEIRSPEFFATDANFWAAFLLSRVEERFLGAESADSADHPAAEQGW
ncbi:type I polyketide synthase [Kitasatospora sp. SUK 42]|uniref:type I polyketide synthase n=1 Tax=Kitasatospora sp. SUK 42 TaxID=1588882 RepID=UPI001C31C437|nr:type I polyketide synthase [Kitasatospora sp. SUK 42]MBV2156584.1 SDR family NAD(P)-dependent oxidoreductase [Kitasatospora sp. SUK 42]